MATAVINSLYRNTNYTGLLLRSHDALPHLVTPPQQVFVSELHAAATGAHTWPCVSAQELESVIQPALGVRSRLC